MSLIGKLLPPYYSITAYSIGTSNSPLCLQSFSMVELEELRKHVGPVVNIMVHSHPNIMRRLETTKCHTDWCIFRPTHSQADPCRVGFLEVGSNTAAFASSSSRPQPLFSHCISYETASLLRENK